MKHGWNGYWHSKTTKWGSGSNMKNKTCLNLKWPNIENRHIPLEWTKTLNYTFLHSTIMKTSSNIWANEVFKTRKKTLALIVTKNSVSLCAKKIKIVFLDKLFLGIKRFSYSFLLHKLYFYYDPATVA